MIVNDSLSTLVVLVVLTEATVQLFFKDIPPTNYFVIYSNYDKSQIIIRAISALVGTAYAFNINLDIFTVLGCESRVPYIGYIASGLIASRGSNYLHDLLGKLGYKNNETIV